MNDNKVPEWLRKASKRIIEHMNDDHSNSIVSTLNAQHGIKDANAKMEKLMVNGYFASSGEKFYFLEFENVCNSAEEYKTELIKHAKKYRNYELWFRKNKKPWRLVGTMVGITKPLSGLKRKKTPKTEVFEGDLSHWFYWYSWLRG